MSKVWLLFQPQVSDHRRLDMLNLGSKTLKLPEVALITKPSRLHESCLVLCELGGKVGRLQQVRFAAVTFCLDSPLSLSPSRQILFPLVQPLPMP